MVPGMDESEALHAFLALLNPALGRAAERSQRGRTLEVWGLNPHRADPATPMAQDDADGYDQKIPEGLTGTVMFPIMNATDALASANVLILAAAKNKPFNHHTPALLSLCRTAIESSAQAIWVMSPEDRAIRRARAAGLAKIGIEHAREFHVETISAHENGLYVLPDETIAQSKHRLKFHEGELKELGSLPQENARKYSELVRKSANWLLDNPPAHTEETTQVHYPTISKLEYRVCSSFTHGHSWPTDLVDGPGAMLSMIADSINLALIGTECAVALYEAQSTDPNGSRTNHYPDRLQVTINQWRSRY